MTLAHKNRKIIDHVTDIVLTLGIGQDWSEALIEWYDETSIARIPNKCYVDSNLLLLGRWRPTRNGSGEDVKEPPLEVVCRATALAVGAAIKIEVLRAVEGLP